MQPVRLGLTSKFNLFILGLMLASVLAVAFSLTFRQLADKYEILLQHGRELAAMLAQNGAYAFHDQDE
ncbi:MAG: hypothetical protein PHE55_10920, partial [Methylococcaceae bacterium]|nr:hypothetical protein [Methylococcaceae bacterium]